MSAEDIGNELAGLVADFHDAAEAPKIIGVVMSGAKFTLLTTEGDYVVEVRKAEERPDWPPGS